MQFDRYFTPCTWNIYDCDKDRKNIFCNELKYLRFPISIILIN